MDPQITLDRSLLPDSASRLLLSAGNLPCQVKYVDQHIVDAENKCKADLQERITELDSRIGSIDRKPGTSDTNDDLIRAIEAVRAAWKKESAVTWEKPW